ncbi:RNA polymerase sigma factor [Fulvivirgaceae bacterium BMA10]|uniref:RNA polymerase sigma factor n=1 Tax=Splendidivirga corallicola TaxID=3051826 RepID=A0ABT8KHA0_9BACT|nr:RNA polymerase sigma factor [Fulvivirgaceae bacterium BMA10]
MDDLIEKSKKGDMVAFQTLYEAFRPKLESFTYRLTADREETQDILQEVFIKAHKHIASFKGKSVNIKSWFFSITANHTKNILTRKKRWHVDAQDVCRDSLVSSPKDQSALVNQIQSSPYKQFEMIEHLDFCFTCLGKTLSMEQQLVLILKDVHQFKVDEIVEITGYSTGSVKHHLHKARTKLSKIYQHRCSLVNKKGVCYQCDELNEIFTGEKHDCAKTYQSLTKNETNPTENGALKSRTKLLQALHPLRGVGTDLHHHLMEHLKKVNKYD